MNDPDDFITYKKSVERLWVHIFLNGLDAEFEQIRGEILRRDPVLDLEETYVYVCRDFVCRLFTMVARRAPHEQNSKTNHHASIVLVKPSHAFTRNLKKASSFIATSENVGKTLHTSILVSHSEWIIDLAFVHLHKGLRTKLEPQALQCVFVGYALHKKGYQYEVETLHHPLENLDFIRGDNLGTSGECPSDDNNMDNRKECPSETSDGPKFFEDENQGQKKV
ncbi:hypothetical protein AAG906_028037 [Vitis piasezkii]